MIGALELMTFTHNWWHRQQDEDRDHFVALYSAIHHLHSNSIGQYSKLKTEAAKVGHFRQLFTVWKAFCSRLPRQDFYDERLDAVRAFPLYFEQLYPELYYVLFMRNIFLGVKFTEEDKKRVKELEEQFLKNAMAAEQKRAEREQMQFVRRVFFGR